MTCPALTCLRCWFQAPEEAFAHGPADVFLQAGDGTESIYRYAKATPVPPSSSSEPYQHAYLLTADTEEWPSQVRCL